MNETIKISPERNKKVGLCETRHLVAAKYTESNRMDTESQ